MAQVQEGLEPKPLPMIRPATPPTVNAVERNTNTGRGGDKADNVLLDLLGTIFGGGN